MLSVKLKLLNQLLKIILKPKCLLCQNYVFLDIEFEYSICMCCKRKLDKSVVQNIADSSYIFKYIDDIRRLILALKVGKKTKTVKILSHYIKKYFLNFDEVLLIPVPSNPKAKKIRTFDHMILICKHLCKDKKFKYLNLLKRKKSLEQKLLSYNQRIKNIKGKIIFKPNFVSSKNVFLVDDISTTGASLNECLKVLMQNNIYPKVLTISKRDIQDRNNQE